MLGKMLNLLIGRPRTDWLPVENGQAHDVPMIAVPRNLPGCSEPRAGEKVDAPIIAKMVNVAPRLARNGPMIGAQRGKAHADRFAAEFAAWVRTARQPVCLEVDVLLAVAAQRFAPAARLAMPVERNFLGALKRLPGIVAMPNKRKYDDAGRFAGKTTVYTILPVEMNTAATTGTSLTGAPPAEARYAA